MADGMIQFHTDEGIKAKASMICEHLGMDLATYMRICVSRLVQENGIPFSMKLQEKEASPALAAMRRASQIAQQYGIADMELEEINAEISQARQQRTR